MFHRLAGRVVGRQPFPRLQHLGDPPAPGRRPVERRAQQPLVTGAGVAKPCKAVVMILEGRLRHRLDLCDDPGARRGGFGKRLIVARDQAFTLTVQRIDERVEQGGGRVTGPPSSPVSRARLR